MAIYQHKFKFNAKYNTDFSLVTVIFDPKVEETDSFLDMQASFSETYDGTKRYDYGARYTSVATLKVTLIKSNATDFSTSNFRQIAQWLSGHRKAQWLDLYNANNQVEYSFLGRFVSVVPYMMDGRCIGIVGTFESTSPWAYSSVQEITRSVTNSASIAINNNTDDADTYIYPSIEFTNTQSNGTLSIARAIAGTQTSETTTITGLAVNEKITIGSNQTISSNAPTRIFGDSFNFVFLRLTPGENNITVSGTGSITIKYRYFLKVANALTDVQNTYSGMVPASASTGLITEARVREIVDEMLGGIVNGRY